MKLGRVAGTVVSTISHPSLAARPLLMCDLLDAEGGDSGGYLICVDAVGAGQGEMVLILDEGNGARQVIGDPHAPIRAVLVGIVDQLYVEGSVVDIV